MPKASASSTRSAKFRKKASAAPVARGSKKARKGKKATSGRGAVSVSNHAPAKAKSRSEKPRTKVLSKAALSSSVATGRSKLRRANKKKKSAAEGAKGESRKKKATQPRRSSVARGANRGVPTTGRASKSVVQKGAARSAKSASVSTSTKSSAGDASSGAKVGQQLKFGFRDDRSELAVLQKQHRSLLLRIAKLRALIAVSKQAVEELFREMSERVMPYREELFAITREVSALSERLLDSSAVPVGQREKVRWVLRQLLATLPVEEAEEGRPDPSAEPARGASDAARCSGQSENTPEGGSLPRGAPQSPSTPTPAASSQGPHGDAEQENGSRSAFARESFNRPEAQSAVKPSGEQSGALRTLFKKLAITYHPDRVQEEAQKAARTKIMKDLTRAFEGGDLARLVEMERTLGLKGPGQPRETEERQVEQLARANGELRAQLAELKLELMSVKEDSPFTLDLRLRDPARPAHDELDQLVLDRHIEVVRASKIREFVASFAAGRMKTADFVKGPLHLGRLPEAELRAAQSAG